MGQLIDKWNTLSQSAYKHNRMEDPKNQCKTSKTVQLFSMSSFAFRTITSSLIRAACLFTPHVLELPVLTERKIFRATLRTQRCKRKVSTTREIKQQLELRVR